MSSVTYQLEFKNRKSDIDLLVKKYPNDKDLMRISKDCDLMLRRSQMQDNLLQIQLAKFDKVIHQYENPTTTTTTPM